MRLSRPAAVAVALTAAALFSIALHLRTIRLDALAARMARMEGLGAPTRGPFALLYHDRPVMAFAGAQYRPEAFAAHPSLFSDASTLWRAAGGTLESCLDVARLLAAFADPADSLRRLDDALPADVARLAVRDARILFPDLPPATVDLDHARGGPFVLSSRHPPAFAFRCEREGFSAKLEGYDLTPFLRPSLGRPDLAACLFTGRLEGRRVADPRHPLSLSGEGRAELRFRNDAGASFTAAVELTIAGSRATLVPPPGTPVAIAGTVDLARRHVDATVDADRFDLGYFGKIFPGADSIFSQYALDGLGGLHLALSGTRPVGVVSFENGVLVGDPGRVNFANLGGEATFDDDAIVLRGFRADYDRTPLVARGRIGRSDGSVDLVVRAEGVPYDKFRSLFTAMGLRIGDTVAGGVFDLALRIGHTVGSPRIEGEGAFSRGRMSFLDDLFEFRQVNGRFTLRDGRIRLAEFDGFWGDIPFRGHGEMRRGKSDDFDLRIDFENFAPEDVDSWIMASLSRMNFGRESSAGIRVASIGDRLEFNVKFNLKAVDANLYPVPGSVTLESAAGELRFHRDASGAVSIERGSFAFRGPATVKLTLPSVTTYPVTVTGEAEGDVTFDERTTAGAAFSGRLSIPAATLSFIDGRYAARRVPVTAFAASFSRDEDLSFAVSAKLLGGTFSARGSSRGAAGDTLLAEGGIEDVSLSAFYQENPRAFDLVSGLLSADFRHRGGDAVPFRATVHLRDGSLRNLAVVNDLFGGRLENRIYYLPFENLRARFAADGRTLRVEEAEATGDDPALGRVLSLLKREIPLRAAAPPESRAFERAAGEAFLALAERGAALRSALRAAGDRHRPFAELLRLRGLEACPPKALLDLWELFGEDAREEKDPARP